jgi:CRISPR-associated protein Csm2
MNKDELLKLAEKIEELNKIRDGNDKDIKFQIEKQVYKIVGFIRENIVNIFKEDPKDLVNYAQVMGKTCSSIKMSTSQIRKFLDAINRIENLRKKERDITGEVILLKPQLAYLAGKQRRAVKPLANVLFPAIDEAAKNEKNFKKLNHFIESIVAYHKFYGGRD